MAPVTEEQERSRVQLPTAAGLLLVAAGALLVTGATATSLGIAVLEILAAALVVTLVQMLGHLGAARAVGLPLYGLVFGGGPRLVGARFGELSVELRALPVGASVSFFPEQALESIEELELEQPPPQSVIAALLGGPLTSVGVSIALLGQGAAAALGLLPAQVGALLFAPASVGVDVAGSALILTQSSPTVIVGTVAAKLGLLQIPANAMSLTGATVRLAGREPSDAFMVGVGLVQVVLTTWLLFGFVYALAITLDG